MLTSTIALGAVQSAVALPLKAQTIHLGSNVDSWKDTSNCLAACLSSKQQSFENA